MSVTYLDIGELARHVDSDGVSCSFAYDTLRRTTEERIGRKCIPFVPIPCC
ncbi:hypothetical protein OH492_12025 [Vibrio chagasii]|nr:hypothetical protein [Vibrio chagasii]